MEVMAAELFRETAAADRFERRPRASGALSAPAFEGVLERLDGGRWLLASLLYHCALRPLECVRLRVRDVDLEHRRITVRAHHGGRAVRYPDRLHEPLRRHLERVRLLHRQDLAAGFGAVRFPGARGQTWREAGREWGWQFLFPSKHRSIDLRGNTECRGHVDPKGLLRTLRSVAREAGLE